MKKEYLSCTLCGRGCGVNRYEKPGACKMSSEISISRADLHHWEEPIISGNRGSGTIFFSGCSLSCVFCQNREISRAAVGVSVSTAGLSDIMIQLMNKGAHNINLVTPTHFVPSIIDAVSKARDKGLCIPIVYNTSSYETPQTVRSLDGTVDIYLADYKYNLP
ncbi:MAG: 4Fe-4S cluster-binding domain-containing protein, partial [Clostridia bacterium]|nr:4Fe-4S cluster-binding domain-containing protein [Clostridia bacterium]